MPSTPLAARAGSGAETSAGLHLQSRSPDESFPEPLTLVGFESSLSTTSLDALEKLALSLTPAWVAERFDRFPGTEEVALLRTCCRRELVVLTRGLDEAERWRNALPGTSDGWTRREGRDLVHHLFRVAGGRESLVVGEKEVRAQLRTAGRSTLSRHRCRLLRDLLGSAADAADQAAPDVPSSRSIAALAATRVLEMVGRPFPRVLVIGSGAVGRQVTELLAPSARVTVTYREAPPDEEFLRLAGARAVKVGDLSAEIAVSDAVVTAAKTGDRCLGLAELPTDRPIVVVDLGVPRNVDPEARRLPSVRLVDLEGLRPAPGRNDPATDRALAWSADRCYDRFARAALEPWIAAARRLAEAVRTRELAVARPFLGPLNAEQEVAIDRLTRRLVDRILLAPTERLRGLPAGDDGDRLRRFALELLRPEPPAP